MAPQYQPGNLGRLNWEAGRARAPEGTLPGPDLWDHGASQGRGGEQFPGR